LLTNNTMLLAKTIIIIFHLALITLMIIPIISREISIWWLDNLVNLQIQWSLLAILLILVSIKFFNTFLIPLSVLYGLIILYNFSFLYSGKHINKQNKESLNIAQLNIKYENPNIDDLIFNISQSDYDVILLQEIGDHEHNKMLKLIDFYPYSVGTSSLENFPSGMALFSRWPIVNKKIHDLGYVEGNIIEVIIQSEKNSIPVQIFALHPGAPRIKTLWQLRNSTLDYLADQVSASLLPYKIIIGDINVSPWSPIFKQFKKKTALNNSANGFGYIPSWAYSSINKLLRVTSSAYIDHCLASNSFNILNKQYQKINGSDHVLVSTELGFEL